VGYAISKAALNMAVAKFAAALKQEGFVFLALSPGLVDTRLVTSLPYNGKS
jgi:NAD(P)-dependent dehydrogenase (short-subunit alcohol dehydrogenase family)